MNILERARRLRHQIEEVATTLPDEDAINYVDLFQKWVSDKEYIVGNRVRYNNVLYKCKQDHTSQAQWNPEDAASLWAKVLPGQDGTDIGEWVQPDSTNPYTFGDKVTHNGKTWISTAYNNVWEPGVYGWEQINE